MQNNLKLGRIKNPNLICNKESMHHKSTIIIHSDIRSCKLNEINKEMINFERMKVKRSLIQYQ
jgi:hypothetical protein